LQADPEALDERINRWLGQVYTVRFEKNAKYSVLNALTDRETRVKFIVRKDNNLMQISCLAGLPRHNRLFSLVDDEKRTEILYKIIETIRGKGFKCEDSYHTLFISEVIDHNVSASVIDREYVLDKVKLLLECREDAFKITDDSLA
jgi:hypothetical protein